MISKVAIAHNENIPDAVATALDALEGLDELFHEKHVAVKPNDTWASPGDTTACTQADSVRAVIQYVKRFDPEKITVTGGSGAAQTEEVFHFLGIDQVIKEEEVEFIDHNRPPFMRVPLEYGPQREVMVNQHVLEYEVLVSLAQLKVHHAATVTLTMKNIAMSFPAADYYGYPREEQLHAHKFFSDLQSFIAGMCRDFPIHLGVITGHPAMIGKGSVGGDVFEAGLVIASTDYVAADAVGAKILGLERVEHIVQAEKLGLGNALFDYIEIVGVPLDEAMRIFEEKSHAVR